MSFHPLIVFFVVHVKTCLGPLSCIYLWLRLKRAANKHNTFFDLCRQWQTYSWFLFIQHYSSAPVVAAAKHA